MPIFPRAKKSLGKDQFIFRIPNRLYSKTKYTHIMCITILPRAALNMLLRLSKKELSAIEAVLDIAMNGGGGLVQSSDIIERLEIPPRYLEPILQRLGRAGVLVGIRGPAGGYRLARERRRITLADLVDAIRGVDDTGETESDRPRNGLTDTGVALTMALDDLDREIHSRLRAVTIENLCWRSGQAAKSPRRASGTDFAI